MSENIPRSISNPFYSRTFRVRGKRYAWAYLDTHSRLSVLPTFNLNQCLAAIAWYRHRGGLQATVRKALQKRIAKLQEVAR